ncbi:MAG: hypothetical protein WCE46_00650 [Methanoregula sp.]|uniref:hypothetical protein n=1 Tax=Methanoregula sp. TaxID=2052170 RepID=UPI003C786A7D
MPRQGDVIILFPPRTLCTCLISRMPATLHQRPDANATASFFFCPVILPATITEKFRISFAGITEQEKKILDLTGAHPGRENLKI